MKSNLLLISLACLSIATFSNYVGNCSGVNYTFHGPYDFVGGTNNTAEVQLDYLSQNYVVPLLMIVKRSYTPPTKAQMDFDTYEHKDTRVSSQYDLQNANTGQPQIVSISGLSAGDKLYIFVINLLKNSSTQYKINVTERSGHNQGHCKGGNPVANNSIYCLSCPYNSKYGSFCDISPTMLPNNTLYSPVIPAWNDINPSFITVTIPASTSLINLVFTASYPNLIIAVQFKKTYSEVAGLLNFASGGLLQSNQSNVQYSVPINSGGVNDISVTFINPNQYPLSLNSSFSVQTSSNILIIVLGVLGGILFIGLVVVAVCIVKKMRNPNQQVNPLAAMMMRGSVRMQNVNDLNNQEIESYFPAVLCRNVINEEEHSSNNLTNQKEKEGDRDCVICLCPIVSTQMIKVTYCRHLFHAQCLNKWFQKQRNCPYCREEYSRTATIEHYQTMLNLTHKNMLAGIDLAKEILLHRQKSNVVIEQFKE